MTKELSKIDNYRSSKVEMDQRRVEIIQKYTGHSSAQKSDIS
jgi:hypothetical protein